MGVATTLLTERLVVHPNWRFLIPIGFVGAYTTFSTFELETFRAINEGSWVIGAGNVAQMARRHELGQRATVLLRNRIQGGGNAAQFLLGLKQQQVRLRQGDDMCAQVSNSRLGHLAEFGA